MEDEESKTDRFNDGAADARGRYWCVWFTFSDARGGRRRGGELISFFVVV